MDAVIAVSHLGLIYMKVWFLWLQQARLGDRDIMSSTCLSVCVSVCLSVTKLVNVIFFKRMN